MALNAVTLKAELKAALKGFFGVPAIDAKLDQFCEAVATTVVTHITTNGVAKITGVQVGPDTINGTIE